MNNRKYWLIGAIIGFALVLGLYIGGQLIDDLHYESYLSIHTSGGYTSADEWAGLYIDSEPRGPHVLGPNIVTEPAVPMHIGNQVLLEDWRKSMCDTAMLLNYTLEDDVFMKASVEIAIPAMVEFYREYFTLEYRYLGQYSNYLALQLRSEPVWQEWMWLLPCIQACAGDCSTRMLHFLR